MVETRPISPSAESDPDDGVVFVELDREHVEMLLHLAPIGEQASARRSSRHGFRRQPCCSGVEREPDCASCQTHGFVTAQQATEMGIDKHALQMLIHRGTLERAAHGVYRFPRYPVGEHDNLMLAVLWTRVPEAALSHETALDAYGTSDVNPNRIHLTVGKQRRFRRTGGDDYVVHYEDLAPKQLGWWQEIPTVTPATAVAQCLAYGTPTYLLRQAIERGHAQGYLKAAERDELTEAVEARHER